MARKFGKVFKGGNFLKPKKWEDWEVGDVVAGVYVGVSKEPDLYGKQIHLIQITEDEDSTNGECKMESNVEDQDGEKHNNVVPLYSNGGLDLQLSEASYGDFVRIEYKGMATTKKGKFKGKPCHNIEVGIDGYVPKDEDGDQDILPA